MSEDPWYAEGLKFKCQTDCGACCKGPEPGWVVVDEEDIVRLAEELEMTVNAFGRKYLRQIALRGKQVLALTEQRSLDCIFWEDGAGCRVYAARPMQCRQWPFWPEMLASEEAWEAEKTTCPGMDVEGGRHYTRAEVDRIAAGKRGTLRGRRPSKLPLAE